MVSESVLCLRVSFWLNPITTATMSIYWYRMPKVWKKKTAFECLCIAKVLLASLDFMRCYASFTEGKQLQCSYKYGESMVGEYAPEEINGPQGPPGFKGGEVVNAAYRYRRWPLTPLYILLSMPRHTCENA